MVLVRYDKRPPNKTLAGHKLLYLLTASWTPPSEDVEAVKQKYPGLELQFSAKSDVTKEQWRDVTIIVTGPYPESLPDLDDVPHLQYVQLASAGANAIVKHPLYTNTDVAICTANGVHG